MTQEIVELGIEITAYVCELHDLTKVIKDMDQEYIKSSTPENKMLIQEVIARYKSNVDKLRVLLEAYFAEEKKAGVPVDFSFRSLYRQLKRAY
jgi:hypothetical protein